MISDILDHEDGSELKAEAIVVGSGIAGAEVAISMARAGVRVLLVESGRDEFDPKIQALNDVRFVGKAHRALDPEAPYHRYLPAELRGVSRLSQHLLSKRGLPSAALISTRAS